LSTAKPHYLAIADHITDEIGTGKLKPGTELPPTRQLADAYGVSMATAYRAVRELHKRGLVVGYQGKGVYVVER